MNPTSPATKTRTRKTLVPLGVALTLTATALTGCGQKAVEACGTAVHDPFAHATKSGHPLDIVVLDVRDNNESAAATASAQTRPLLVDAMRHGAYISVTADGGDGSPLTQSPCFTGTSGALFMRASGSKADTDDANTGADMLATQIHDLVRATPVHTRGSARRLLDHAAALAATARQGTAKVSDINVIVLSAMLASDGPHDCLSLDGQTANTTTATNMAKACLASGQVHPMPTITTLRFLGVAQGATTFPQQVLAQSLTTALGPLLSTSYAPTPTE